MTRETIHDRAFVRIQGNLAPLSTGILTAVNVVVAASLWHEPRAMIICAASFAGAAFFNLYICTLLWPYLGFRRISIARTGVNVVGFLIVGHESHWGLPILAGVLTMGAIHGAARQQHSALFALAFSTLMPVVAVSDGLPLLDGLVVGLATMGIFLLSARAAGIAPSLLNELDEQNRQLVEAHEGLVRARETAVANEKLAGLGRLAAGVAHEINNPLSYVRSNIHQLLEDLVDAPELPPLFQPYRDEILPETLVGMDRMATIVADLRAFARSKKEGAERYDLNEEVRRSLRIAREKLQNCQVETQLGDLPVLVGRPDQIGQVVLNLLVNAAQATDGGGRITVSTRIEAGEVVLAIEDSGVGMDETTVRHLFEPFFTTKPQGHGTGLGLSVAHGIVQAHDGRIQVASQLGKGSCFSVHLRTDLNLA